MKIERILIVFAVALLVCSCKTTEQNYRAAYDLARGEGVMQDSLVANLIANEQAPIEVKVGDETMKMRKEYVSVVAENGATKESLKQYNVVVGRFRQIFNARSMAERMKLLGYQSFIVNDRTPAYYVVVASADDLAQALQQYKKAIDDCRVVYKTPFPWVLEPAQYIRQKTLK